MKITIETDGKEVTVEEKKVAVDYLHMTMVIDRSGSMRPLAEESSGSVNRMLKEQSDVDGKMTASIYQFDDKYEKVFGPADVAKAPKYTLIPRGMTALNDAVMRAIADTRTDIKAMPKNQRPDKVVVVIVTDGMENASQEVTNAQLKDEIERRKTKGWEFIFLASGMDAFATGTQYGAAGVQMAATKDSYTAAYAATNAAVTNARIAGGSVLSNFSTVDFTNATTTDEEED